MDAILKVMQNEGKNEANSWKFKTENINRFDKSLTRFIKVEKEERENHNRNKNGKEGIRIGLYSKQ